MPRAERVDTERLEEYLRALAYQPRLELLQLLKMPHALADIRVGAGRALPGASTTAMSRQALQAHLDKLVEIGALSIQEPEGGGKRGREYVVNLQQLYHILEELRKVASIQVGAPVKREPTIELDGGAGSPMEPGPKLVLVHGLLDGKAFPLRRTDLKGERGWVLGRKPGLHVTLSYDPYVSLENSEIVPEGGHYQLMDLRASKNGTWVNWRRLGKDERVALRPGDVVGVGRSLLVFRSE